MTLDEFYDIAKSYKVIAYCVNNKIQVRQPFSSISMFEISATEIKMLSTIQFCEMLEERGVTIEP